MSEIKDGGPAFPWANLHGYQLIESLSMTDWYELIRTKRTLKERFFTRPWMPWVDYAWERGPRVPAMSVVIMGNKIIGHPAIIKGITDTFSRGKVIESMFAEDAEHEGRGK